MDTSKVTALYGRNDCDETNPNDYEGATEICDGDVSVDSLSSLQANTRMKDQNIFISYGETLVMGPACHV